jgi:hypothetical protein
VSVTFSTDALGVSDIVFECRFVESILKASYKLVQLGRAYGTEHKQGGARVQSALASDEGEASVKCRVICVQN